MGATCGAGSAYPSAAPEITPSFWWGSCCLFFSFICCLMCTIVCLFVFFIFSHGVVSLFSINDFDCPSGIFRHSLLTHINKTYKTFFIETFDFNIDGSYDNWLNCKTPANKNQNGFCIIY